MEIHYLYYYIINMMCIVAFYGITLFTVYGMPIGIPYLYTL